MTKPNWLRAMLESLRIREWWNHRQASGDLFRTWGPPSPKVFDVHWSQTLIDIQREPTGSEVGESSVLGARRAPSTDLLTNFPVTNPKPLRNPLQEPLFVALLDAKPHAFGDIMNRFLTETHRPTTKPPRPVLMNDSIQQTIQRLDRLCDEAATDRDKLNALFAAARPRLVRVIALRSPQTLERRVDADDVVQEAFARATQRFETYVTERRVPVFVWLRGLAIDLLVELQRKHLGAEKRAMSREVSMRQWMQETSLEMTRLWDSDAKSPSRIISDRQRGEDLKQAIEMLPDNYREVLVLRFFESLSVAETAAAMDCSVANAKVLQFRAMKKLQEIIENRIGWNSADQVG